MVEILQAKIDQTAYWDLKILDFHADFFGDEVNIFVYNDADTSWKISFYHVSELHTKQMLLGEV